MKLKKDKLKHFIVGFIIALLVYLATKDQTISAWVVIASGALKEVVWDKVLKKGTPEFYDFVATFFGWILLSLIVTLFF